MSFATDITGKDTNIYPVVVIGESIYISTNSTTIDGQYYKPILLSMPSLKESIDIEKTRKYKISSLTLSISLYEVDGERFNESVGDSSLINQSVDIYWISPTVTQLGDGTGTEGNAKLIFKGTVLRYSHDDDKASIVVEDKSQSIFHKDLPIETMPLNQNIPVQSRGNPVPMCYGYVDRSPVVFGAGHKELIVDWQPITSYEENINIFSVTEGSLYMHQDSHYINVFKADQYEYQPITHSNPKIIFNSNNIAIFPETETELTGDGGTGSTTATGELIEPELKCADSSKNISLSLTNPDDPTWGDHDTEGFTLTEYPKTIDAITDGSYDVNNIELHGGDQHQTGGETVNSVQHLADQILFYDVNVGNILIEFKILYKFLFGDDDDEQLMIKSLLKLNLSFVPQYDYNKDKEIYVTNFAINGRNLTNIINWVPTEGSDPGGTWAIVMSNAQTASGDWGGDSFGRHWLGSFYTITTYPSAYSALNELFNFISLGNGGNNADADLNIDIGVEKNGNNIDSTLHIYGELNEIDIVRKIYATKIFKKDYYANIKGRKGQNEYGENILLETAPDIISHIMNVELLPSGAGDIVAQNEEAYSSWKYAFTVASKKINSKKLFENISSASPYIPHYNNLGEFSFDVIKMSYNLEDIAASTRIEASDCISWSYKRSKIEEIFTSIELKFKIDYAADEFLETTGAINIDDTDILPVGSTYTRDYYGLEGDDNTTLVIDDDRGKYIRDLNTANQFVRWMLLWHCNSHLLITVRLSLKYIDIQVGSLCSFDKVMGNVKPYNIDYGYDADYLVDGTPYVGHELNGQQIYPIFMCIKSTKTLEYCEYTLCQLHNLSNEYEFTEAAWGCRQQAAWNYNPEADFDDGSCVLGSSFIHGDDCPLQSDPLDVTLFSSNPTEHDINDPWVFSDTVDYGEGVSVHDAAEAYWHQYVENKDDPAPDPIILLQTNCVFDIQGHNLKAIYFSYYVDPGGDQDVFMKEHLITQDPEENDYGSSIGYAIPIDQELKDAYISEYAGGGYNLKWKLKFVFEYDATDEFGLPIVPDYQYGNFYYNFKSDLFNAGSQFPSPSTYNGIIQTNSEGDGIYETNEFDFNLLNGLFDPGIWNLEGYGVQIKMVYKFNPVVENVGEGTTQFERSIAQQNEINIHFTGQGDVEGDIGDMNNDGSWDIIDVVMLTQCLLGGYCHSEYGWQGDMDGNSAYTILDLVSLTNCVLDADCAEKYGAGN